MRVVGVNPDSVPVVSEAPLLELAPGKTSDRRRNVLKKAGILVAATAAGLLAVSPLAFASGKGGPRATTAGTTATARSTASTATARARRPGW
jgi:hypothetical protein